MRRLFMVALLAFSAAVSGCSYQTAGSPKGGVTLSADFADVQNLVVGHSVQISGVRIGTVTGIKLVGTGKTYRVRVTMSLRRGIKVPVGSTAQLSITSLLGENYVALQFPPAGLDSGPFLASGAHLGATTVVPAFEQVVGKAGPLLSALSGNDISTVVNAGSTAFNGKGPALQKMIGQTNQLLELFAGQRAHLDSTIGDLAAFGRQIAKGQDELGRLPQGLAKTTQMLANDRYQLLDTISKITDLAKTTNDTVLAGHVAQLRRLIEQLGPVISTLASDKTNLAALITTMQEFVAKVPRAIYNGQLLLYPVLVFQQGPSSMLSKESALGVLAKVNEMLGRGR